MPELPEVETIKRDLTKVLTGRKIINLRVTKPRLIKNNLSQFKRYVVGSRIISVNRRAKLLCLELSSGYTLLIHLKMTGQLVWQSPKGTTVKAGGHPIPGVQAVPNKYTYITVTLSDDSHLYFNDVRLFGYWQIVSSKNLNNHLKHLGPEPFSREFTPEYLHNIFKRRKNSPIKAILLDQTVLAGLGNIYVDETLFVGQIKPHRRSGTITIDEIKKLRNGIKKVLQKSIQAHGTSFNTFVDAWGRRGTYWDQRLVYGRKNEPCPNCKKPIKKTVIAGRGTHFCAKCQK